MATSPGLHHVTAITGNGRRNIAFYMETLGLRLVKRTVNFDDPGTWHLYYGDAAGTPGTIMTFFVWENLPAARPGAGEAVEIAFAVPEASLAFWIERFVGLGVPHGPLVRRFGQRLLPFRDPDGMHLELVGMPPAEATPTLAGSAVPQAHAIRGFAGATLWVDEPGPTARMLEQVFGYVMVGEEDTRRRYRAGPPGSHGAWIDLRTVGGFLPGRQGAGSVHHLALRASSDADQAAMAARLHPLGLRHTGVIDRTYFRSIYLREPAGATLEIATDAPGFAVDEPADELGGKLVLPPWYEPHRARIEAALPALS